MIKERGDMEDMKKEEVVEEVVNETENVDETVNEEETASLKDKFLKKKENKENEKSTKFEQYEQKTMNIYNSIEETKENNNKKFNDVKEQILVIQKTLEDDSNKRETAHNEFMDFMKKMEEKIFEKFDMELQAKKEIEVKVAQYLEEKKLY